MSAYIVDRAHIVYLVQASQALGHSRGKDTAEAVRIAQVLWDENIRSVRTRYPDCDDLPGPTNDDYKIRPQDLDQWEWEEYDPVQVLKACLCYQYQTRHAPSWTEREAWAFLQLLIHRAIRSLEGYEDAEWGAPPLAEGPLCWPAPSRGHGGKQTC